MASKFYKHGRGGPETMSPKEQREPEAKPESKAAAEEGQKEPGGGEIVDRAEKGAPAGRAMRGGMKAEREEQHRRHEAERLALHHKHREEHRRMHEEHEAQHAKVKDASHLARLHREHEHELIRMRHGHMHEHHELQRRHHEEDQRMHEKHEHEMFAQEDQTEAGGMEKEAA